MAHLVRAGTGLWSCRREPAKQSPPIRATIPCATASLAGRIVVPNGSALRPDARYSQVAGRPAHIHLQQRSAKPFWPEPHRSSGPAWRQGWRRKRWHPRTGQGLRSRVKAPSPASIRCPWSDPSLRHSTPEGSATRACRPRGFGRAERTRVIADPVRHFGRLSRGGWSSAPKDRS